MWIDDNIIPYVFQKQGVQADSCLGQSMHSPFGQRLPCLTAYVADTARADVSVMKYK